MYIFPYCRAVFLMKFGIGVEVAAAQRSSDTPKLLVPIRLLYRPYISVSNTVLQCNCDIQFRIKLPLTPNILFQRCKVKCANDTYTQRDRLCQPLCCIRYRHAVRILMSGRSNRIHMQVRQPGLRSSGENNFVIARFTL